MLRIPPMKEPKKIKKAFTYSEIEKMRWDLSKHVYLKYTNKLSIQGIRNQAIFELFLSSGIRVGELVTLKIDNVDFGECKAIVTGKGNKERIVYLTRKQKIISCNIWNCVMMRMNMFSLQELITKEREIKNSNCWRNN